jgi:hypothetical protein
MQIPKEDKNWDDESNCYSDEVLKLWARCVEVCVEVSSSDLKMFAFTLWEIDCLPERE